MARKGWWRIGAVWGLLLAASLACSVSFSTARIESAHLATDEAGTNETDVFGPQDTIYLIVELASAPDDTTTRAVWTAVEVEGADPNTQIGDYELESGSGTLTFTLEPETAWPVGAYQVVIYLNDDEKETLEYRVV
jgi:hypothetical protein